ncbi:MAG: M48 family metallopeptidase [Litorimonas sp.]
MVLTTGCADSSAAPELEATHQPAPTPLPTSATRAADTTFEDVLAEYQGLNQRLARVAAPLRLKNAKLCPQTRRDPGFTIHRLEDYPKPIRPMAESLLGVKPSGIYVRAVRPNTSAAEARIEPGDKILAVNGNPISSEKLMNTYNRAVLRNGFDSVLSKVRIRTASGQEFLARIRPDTACDIPAKVVFSNDINGHTDGTDVLITSALMRSVPDDTNLALVIAHEMAHVIAGHIDKAPSQELELEADRMALVLMARAGYDIEAAVAYWDNTAHPHEGGSETESSHPSTQARYENFQTELKRIRKAGDVTSLTF